MQPKQHADADRDSLAYIRRDAIQESLNVQDASRNLRKLFRGLHHRGDCIRPEL
jgi:hypothetical protein